MGSLASALSSGFAVGQGVGGAFGRGQLQGTQLALGAGQLKDINSLIEARDVQIEATKADTEFMKLFTDKIKKSMGEAAARESQARKDVAELSAMQGVDLLAAEAEQLTQLLAQGQIQIGGAMDAIEQIALGRSAAGGAAGPLPGETAAGGQPPSAPLPPTPPGGARPGVPDPRVGLNIGGALSQNVGSAASFFGEAAGNAVDLASLGGRALFSTVPQSEVDRILGTSRMLAGALVGGVADDLSRFGRATVSGAAQIFEQEVGRTQALIDRLGGAPPRPSNVGNRFFNPDPGSPSLLDIPPTQSFSP